MKSQTGRVINKRSFRVGNAGMITRVAVASLALLGSIVIGLVVMGTFQAFASVVKETPTQATPWGVAFDKSGHVWVAEPGCDAEPNCPKAFPSYIGEYAISNGSLVNNYLQPKGFSSPAFLAIDKNGNIWFTEPTTNRIGKLVPGATPKWQQWLVPTPAASPYDLVIDNNGKIWFTEFNGNKIGFFNPVTRTFAEKAIATANSHPYGITKDIHGNIWFAENNVFKIASFTPTTTGAITITEHPVNANNTPHLITSDAAGNIWYSEGFSGDIGKFVPKTKVNVNINVSKNLCPGPTPGVTPGTCSGTHISGMAVDSKGRIWFDDSLSARVGYYTPSAKTVTTLTLGNTSAHPYDGLGIDSSGNAWFTEEFGGPTGMLGEIPAGSL